MKQTYQALTPRDTLILQQISDDYEEDVDNLAHELGEPREKIIGRLHALRRKGLVVVSERYTGAVVRLSRKGGALLRYMWPESVRSY